MIQMVLRWEIPVDDEWHRIGAGPVAHVASRTHRERPGDLVEVWTIEEVPDPAEDREHDTTFPVPMRPAIAVGTGHATPRGAECIGTAVVPTLYLPGETTLGLSNRVESSGGAVWHVFAVVEGVGVRMPPGMRHWNMDA